MKPIFNLEERSKELMSVVPDRSLFVGLCGVSLGFDEFEIRDYGCIRKVTNPPMFVHICSAANLEELDYIAVGRYSLGIQAELAFGDKALRSKVHDESFLLGVAWHAAALIKLRGHTSLFCPVSASISWDIIGAIKDHTVIFRVLDDVPRQIVFQPGNTKVSKEDIQWVKTNWENSLMLRDKSKSRRFGLAFNLAYMWNQTKDERMALANLWCGLEALFGCQSDIRVKEMLVNRISNWLPSLSKTYVRELYKIRCDAVHGRFLDNKGVGTAIRDTEAILRDAVVTCIERTSVPLPDWT